MEFLQKHKRYFRTISLSEKEFYVISTIIILSTILIIYVLDIHFYSGDVNTARYLLSSIAQGLSAVLAIVFTVTFVLLQSSHSKYLSSLIFKEPNVKFTILVNCFTIIYSIVIMRDLRDELKLTLIQIGLIEIAYILTFFSISSIIVYVWVITNYLVPRLCIKRIGNKVISYIKKKNLWNDKRTGVKSEIKDCFKALGDITKRLINEYDYTTANKGIHEFKKICINYLENKKHLKFPDIYTLPNGFGRRDVQRREFWADFNLAEEKSVINGDRFDGRKKLKFEKLIFDELIYIFEVGWKTDSVEPMREVGIVTKEICQIAIDLEIEETIIESIYIIGDIGNRCVLHQPLTHGKRDKRGFKGRSNFKAVLILYKDPLLEYEIIEDFKRDWPALKEDIRKKKDYTRINLLDYISILKEKYPESRDFYHRIEKHIAKNVFMMGAFAYTNFKYDLSEEDRKWIWEIINQEYMEIEDSVIYKKKILKLLIDEENDPRKKLFTYREYYIKGAIPSFKEFYNYLKPKR